MSLPDPAADPGLVTEKPSARASEPDRTRSPMVRAGSAGHREPWVLGGHERSRQVSEIYSSPHPARRRPRPLQKPDGGFEPSPQQLPRASGPCQRGNWSPRTGLTPAAEVVPLPLGLSMFSLTGRALDVP